MVIHKDSYATLLRSEAAARFNRADYDGAALYAARSLDVEQDVDAMVLLGESLRRKAAFTQAVQVFKMAHAHKSDSVAVLIGLGAALFGETNFTDAEVVFRRAIELKPTAAAHTNLALIYQEQCRLEEAVFNFRRAMELDPTEPVAHSNLLYALCFKANAAPAEVFAEHRRFHERFARQLRDPRPHSNRRDPERRLRIGYLCHAFRRYSAGFALMAPIERHDGDRFEVRCYSVNRYDDDFTDRFRRAAEGWVEAGGMSDAELAARIRADGIDILVDAAGHMEGNRMLVLARKPAPIQVSFPTYPNTTGLTAVDYRIADPYFAPAGAESFHSERLVRLPETHVCYEPHRRSIEVDTTPPAARLGVVTFGSFNNFGKINDATLALWGRVLAACPVGRLMLKWRGLNADRMPDWLSPRLHRAGIDPQRVVLAGWAPDAYEPYREVDICLDPLHSNGGMTTCDALWNGVPVVTRFGETPFSRVGLCHLTNIGLPDLIAGDDDSYVRIAAGLGNSLDRLASLRHGLHARFAVSPTTNGERYTRHLESAYREMWRHWCFTSSR